MHHVGRLAETTNDLGVYAGHSEGLSRLALVDRAARSVHQTVTVAELEPGGRVQRHLHAHEEAIYVLDGGLTLSLPEGDYELVADDYVFIEAGVAHAVSNTASARARWYELAAPQPSDGFADTAWPSSSPPETEVELAFRRGRFAVDQLPPPSGTLGLAGFGGANVGGASLKMLIDREFGASQFNLMVLQYAPGGMIKEHDHAFEEAFLFLDGEIEAVLDGTTYVLRAGDYCWSGVASMHSFANRSEVPVRWIETQVPQPPSRHQARFRGDWEALAGAG
jgi:quercetin dioxygenase-like cupin family protein